jgi:deoxyribonucleoside regulator
MITNAHKKEIATKASILYYEKNKSQSYIANELGVSRSYVSLLLNFAKEQGIVKILVDVDTFNLRMIRKEIELKSFFPKVKQFYIMQSVSNEFTESNIGQFAAPYVADMVKRSNVVGIGLGKSVYQMINNLKREDFLNLGNNNKKKIVQMMGGLSNSAKAGTHSNELVKRLSEIINYSEYYYLHYAAIFEDPDIKKILLNERSLKSTIEMWDYIDLAIMGIGVADKRSTLFKLFNKEMAKKVENSKAVGQINANFFDVEGNDIPILEDNKICIPIEKMKKIRNKIVIGFEEYKVKSIYGALKGGYIDIFFTDSITIDALENYIKIKENKLKK